MKTAVRARRKPGARSSVTNGSRTLSPGVDERTHWVRRLRDIQELHFEDFGGADALTEAERSLVRRIATLTCALEKLDLKFAIEGDTTDKALDTYQRTSANLRRLLQVLGIRRRPERPKLDLTKLTDAELSALTVMMEKAHGDDPATVVEMPVAPEPEPLPAPRLYKPDYLLRMTRPPKATVSATTVEEEKPDEIPAEVLACVKGVF